MNKAHKEHYDMLFRSGLYDELVGAHLLVPHEEVNIQPEEPEHAYKIIRPELVDFVSYPYEWCFGQLKDAALATLAIQNRAMERDMSLRDASAYNIQFHRGRPVLIDTLSFEPLDDSKPWAPYRQYCQHFLGPLALMSYRDPRLVQLLRVHIDGVPLDLITRLLPHRARFRVPLLLHLFLHARAQKRYAGEGAATAGGAGASRGNFSLRALQGIIDSLGTGTRRLAIKHRASQWVGYYEEATHYSSEALEDKQRLVTEFVAQTSPFTVWDVGANTGLFSRIPAEQGIHTVAFEMDPASVEENYRAVKRSDLADLLPLVCDLTNPSPGTGWANEERSSLEERGPADLVMALALIHHLAIANNLPLALIAGYLSRICRSLVIEFVPKDDIKVRQLLSTREDIFPDYSQEGFESAFKASFDTERVEKIGDSGRLLYLMRAR